MLGCASQNTEMVVNVLEMAAAAKKFGYEYILITDHSKAVTIANGLDDQRAIDHIAEIKAADPRRRALVAVFDAWWEKHRRRRAQSQGS